MHAIAPQQCGPADVLRFGEIDFPDVGLGEALERVRRATISPHVSPFSGAAYIAALRGDPWRPQV